MVRVAWIPRTIAALAVLTDFTEASSESSAASSDASSSGPQPSAKQFRHPKPIDLGIGNDDISSDLIASSFTAFASVPSASVKFFKTPKVHNNMPSITADDISSSFIAPSFAASASDPRPSVKVYKTSTSHGNMAKNHSLPTSSSFVFRVSVISSGAKKRATDFYLGNADLGKPSGPKQIKCSHASHFTSDTGDDLKIDGHLISTDPGIPSQLFAAGPSTKGSITTTFRLQDGKLAWFNEAFEGGKAVFCSEDGFETYAIFDNNPPSNCVPIDLEVIMADRCAILDGDQTSPDHDAQLSLGPWTFSLGSFAPTDELQCATSTRSWIEGATTLLPTPSA